MNRRKGVSLNKTYSRLCASLHVLRSASLKSQQTLLIIFTIAFSSALSFSASAENSVFSNRPFIRDITSNAMGAEATSLETNYLRFYPIVMEDGSRLTLISPNKLSRIARQVSTYVVAIHDDLANLFGAIPPFRTSIRLMEEQDFYKLTGAPEWTNAMFFRGEIIIPLNSESDIDLDNLNRSVRHEYSHAVFSSMSAGRIPGWIDEGLAQWIEGAENPVLKASLKKYLQSATPIALQLLQGGFTKLPSSMVPAAYAESLIAMQAIVRAYGTEKIGAYLTNLRNGVPSDRAFESTFRVSPGLFEKKLHKTLRVWQGDTLHQGTTGVITNQNPERARRRTRK